MTLFGMSPQSEEELCDGPPILEIHSGVAGGKKFVDIAVQI